MKKSLNNIVGFIPEKMFVISSANQKIIDLIIDKSGWPDESTIISVALISMLANLNNDVVKLNDKDMKTATSIMNKDSKSFSVRHAVKRSLLYYSGYLREIENELKLKTPKLKGLKRNKE